MTAFAVLCGTGVTACLGEISPAGSGDDAGAARDAPALDVYPGDALSGDDSGQPDGMAREDGSVPRDAAPDGPCVDECPAPNGVTWSCEKRFMYGVNWAWRDFAGDFGGIAAWGIDGVSQAPDAYSSDMAAMKAAGVSVIRWWMFPRFWTESITWAADDTPSGIGGTLVADVHKALELADQHDLFLMLTPFSFDSFTPSRDESGIYTPGIQPMVVDPAKRRRLLDNLVKPVAEAVEASPYRDRMVAWDMVNEPEWAMTGPNLYGGEDFTPTAGLQTVTHAEMEDFMNDMAATLHAASGAPVSIGSAAIKWGAAWTHVVGLDFYQLHYYDWVYEWYPYATVTLASVGLTDKPVVMGEFPIQGLSAIGGNPARTATEFVSDLWSYSYAGALSWAFNDSSFPWDPSSIEAFAQQHACETAY